jgi:ABC-type branched-subunit amino acid transport system substrate-binding protein
MHGRWRRVALSGAAVLIVASAAVACSSSGGATAGSTATSSGGSGAASSGSSSTSGGSAAPSVTIGLLFPFSGPAASYGQLFDVAVKAGLQVVQGKYGSEFTLTTVQEDSQNSAQGATTAMNALASVEHVNVTLTSGTAPSLAAAPIAERSGIPLINGSAVDPKLADASGGIINLAPLADQQVDPLVPFAVNTSNLKKFAIIHTTDAMGTTLDDEFTKVVGSSGGQIVKDLGVAPSLTDFSAQAALIKATDAQGIYLADSVGVVQYAPIFSQFRAAGLTQTFLGFNALHVPQVMSLDGVAGSLLVDQIVDLDNTNWATAGFNEAWKTLGKGQQATPYVVNYANAVIVIGQAVDALVHAGKEVTNANLLSAIHALAPATIIGGTVTIAANGTTDQPLAIYQLTGNGGSKVVQKVAG